MNRILALLRTIWSSARLRILAIALVTGIASGLTGIGQPLDDVFAAVRMRIESRPSDGKVVVITLDDRTLREIQSLDTPRALDARLINIVMGAGAKRFYFDRVYQFAQDEQDDAKLIEALKTWRGRIYMGANNDMARHDGVYAANIPNAKFRPYVGVVSLMGQNHPLMLSSSMAFSAESPIGRIPSMSASIADVSHPPGGFYVPDYAIDSRTIPSYSYIDVIRGRVAPAVFAGTTVVLSPAYMSANDMHYMPARGYVQGTYFHVIGAETLKRGIPLQVGWLPLLLMAMFVLASGIRRGQALDAYRISGMCSVLVILPFVLDHWSMEFQMFPAAAALIVGVLRSRSLDRVERASETNPASGLPTLKQLRDNEGLSSQIMVALRIRNYSGIIGSFAGQAEAQVAYEIVRRIRISDPDVAVYQEGATFVWMSSIVSPVDLCENLEGLHRIVQNGINVFGIDVDLAFNCGVDAEFARPISSRVATAMQSAEEAVRGDELVVMFESDKHEAHWELSLLTQLDRAIDNGEVWVAYQPKLDLRSGQITGAEALVRWTHAERGPISPEKFIGIAEEYHRIERITRFVIGSAVRTAVAMQRLGYPFSVSVNISAQLLRNPELPAMIGELLEAHRLDASSLILEITETDRLERSSRTFRMLEELVASGLRLSIDDFGTGNATIDYLRYLPADEVKIDKVFVSTIDRSPDDLLLVQSIIDMAHSLKRTVIAEGVETREAFDILRDLGCDQIQGYHVSPPVPFRDLGEIIAARETRWTG